jgi:hypothetical protein
MSTPTPTSTADPLGLLATARALAIDAAGAQVVRAWREGGIDAILLKGASTATWLYGDAARAYEDVDLLVEPSRVSAAEGILHQLGFSPWPRRCSDHAHPWLRESDGVAVDLHTTLWGVDQDPRLVWEELRRGREPLRLGEGEVDALSVPLRALHLALHAAQHPDSPERRRDLSRALERAEFSDWQAAERLAERLWALPMMGFGLNLDPAGRELLEHLPLARAGLLRAEGGAPLAIGIARLRRAEGARAKASVLAAALCGGGDESRGRLSHATLRRLARLAGGLPRSAVSLGPGAPRRHGRP